VGGDASRYQKWVATTSNLWDYMRQILVLPYAASALRAMHRSDSSWRCSRNSSDRFTGYSRIITIGIPSTNIRSSRSRISTSFPRAPANLAAIRDILHGVEHPELLYLSLLFHDVGKGMRREPCGGEMAAVKGVLERLRLDSVQRDIVNFLIGSHLRMSATVLRRDIFDPEASP